MSEVAASPKYPHVHVQLTDEDGNAFFIIGRVRRALRQAGVDEAEIEAFSAEAMAGNYDHVLQTVMRWVSAS